MNKQTLHLCRVKALLCRIQSGILALFFSTMLTMVFSQGKANPDSSYITMHLTNASIEKAFTIIKQQTPFRVIYDNSVLKAAKPITISVERASLTSVLNQLLQKQPFDYRIVDETIILTPRQQKNDAALLVAYQQTQTAKDTIITGTVVEDSTLLPLAGATVIIHGTNASVVTDNAGKFQLSIPVDGATLVVSYIGHATRNIQVNKKSTFPINVWLAKIPHEMQEVTIVSTGYESMPSERVTGSFTTINKNLYNQQIGTNALDRLKFISNGVTSFSERLGFGGGSMIIRGLSTLTVPIAKPLIIVDNFPYEGSLENINPNDIENVTFLKDAAAGSIWGAKAANGVIVFTTKKGKYNQKTSFEFNSNITVVERPDLLAIPNMSTSDFIDVEQLVFNNKYRFSDTNNKNKPPFSEVYEILFKQRRGEISSAEANSKINELRKIDVRNEFDEYFYRKAVNQQYSLNIRGGTSNLSWILSGGYDKNISTLDAEYDRVNVRLNNTYKPTRNIELTTVVYYTHSNTLSGKPAYGNISTSLGPTIPPYSRFTDGNGSPVPIYIKYRQPYIDTAGAGRLLDWKYYPLEDYKHRIATSSLTDINAVIGLNYKVLSWLNIDIKYRYENQATDINVIQDQQSFYTRDLINSFSQLNRATGVVKYIVPKGDIVDISNAKLTAQDLRGQVNVDKTWKKFNIAAIAGAQISEVSKQGNSYRTYGYSQDVLTFANVDFSQPYLFFISGNGFIPNGADFNETNNRFVSYYANSAFTYQRKYSLSISARKDASNTFGLDINDKWKPLWSAGISWDISKENYYKINWIPYLRLRATYGLQGNVDPSKVSVTTFRYESTNPYTLTPYGNVNNFYNPGLKWEQTAMTNFGVDFRILGNRIGGSLEFYQKKMSDLYGTSYIDITAGLGTNQIVKNVGEMKGNGIDMQLNTLNVNGAIKWSSTFIFNYYKDKVTKFYESPKEGYASYGLLGFEGYPTTGYFAFKWGGLDPLTGDPQGYLNGAISKDYSTITGGGAKVSDIKFIGTLMPVYYGSFGNTVSWKNLSVTALLTYKFDYYFKRPSINYSSLISGYIGHSDYENRWQNPGDELSTNVPSFAYPANSSRDNFYSNAEILATKGDHIRFQYLNISYDLNKENFKGLPFTNLNFYTVANNLGILWRANNEKLDPDFNSNNLPQKSFSIGLKITL